MTMDMDMAIHHITPRDIGEEKVEIEIGIERIAIENEKHRWMDTLPMEAALPVLSFLGLHFKGRTCSRGAASFLPE